MFFGYNTNGFPHHPLDQAISILADLGYEAVAITLDHHCLNPFGANLKSELKQIKRLLRRRCLRSSIETGARFLLDPWHKHQPTLISARARDRAQRLDFLNRAVDIASALGSEVVSFWSGAPDDSAGYQRQLDRLVEACRRLCDYAQTRAVRLAFEPEPGMLIDSMDRYAELKSRIDHPAFGLTLDVGHLQCQGEMPLLPHVKRWRDSLWNVHIDDMRRGCHEHLMFGDGEINFPSVLSAFRTIHYRGGLYVELSRHGHAAVETARLALGFLRSALRNAHSPAGAARASRAK